MNDRIGQAGCPVPRIDFDRLGKPGALCKTTQQGASHEKRGETYRQWCDPILHHQTHEQTLDDGTCLEVQTRLSRTGATQLFIGVYDADGNVVCEQIYDQRPGETMTRALMWGWAMPGSWPSKARRRKWGGPALQRGLIQEGRNDSSGVCGLELATRVRR